jgi:hypothetical protein
MRSGEGDSPLALPRQTPSNGAVIKQVSNPVSLDTL